jgi:hypothetical protein
MLGKGQSTTKMRERLSKNWDFVGNPSSCSLLSKLKQWLLCLQSRPFSRSLTMSTENKAKKREVMSDGTVFIHHVVKGHKYRCPEKYGNFYKIGEVRLVCARGNP